MNFKRTIRSRRSPARKGMSIVARVVYVWVMCQNDREKLGEQMVVKEPLLWKALMVSIFSLTSPRS